MRYSSQEKIQIRETFKKLSKIERNFGLFKLSYNKIPLWIYIRERAMNMVSGISRPSGQSISSQKINLFNFIKRFFYFLINSYKLFGNEVIIFTNERHLQRDSEEGKYYNPYVELVLNTDKFRRVLIFEFPTPMTEKYRKIKYNRYLPLDLFLALKQIFSFLSLFYYGRIRKEYNNKLHRANLWDEQDIKEILRFCTSSVYNIKHDGIFLKFIKFLNPRAKLIYSCQAGYDKFPEVIEVQHGVILDFHPQYIYPKTPAIQNYLKKKKIIVFSEKVKDLFIKGGYLSENIKVTFNPKIRFYFLKNLKKDFFQQDSVPNKILIISDWGGNFHQIFKNFVLDIEKNKEKLERWEISLILHPTEENVYKDLNLTKVKVFENHEVSLWDLVSEAICIISIASTILEEATYFGCFNIILSDKEFEDQKDYINWLCGDYPHKTIVDPEKFIEWFEKNKSKIISHLPLKKKIMGEYYDNFLSRSNL